MSKKIVVIIQARMGSTRLPGKVLMNICGKPMLEYTIDSLKNSAMINEIVLATSISETDDVLENFAREQGISFFRGSESDVLNRYYEAAQAAQAEVVVRVTGDCPLIDYTIVDKVIETFMNGDVDFASNTLGRTFPRGMDTEVFSFSALAEAHRNATELPEREHVTLYILRHPEIFKLGGYKANGRLERPDIRLTVDTPEDFELIQHIITAIPDRPILLTQVIDFLEAHADLLKINQHIEQKKDQQVNI